MPGCAGSSHCHLGTGGSGTEKAWCTNGMAMTATPPPTAATPHPTIEMDYYEREMGYYERCEIISGDFILLKMPAPRYNIPSEYVKMDRDFGEGFADLTVELESSNERVSNEVWFQIFKEHGGHGPITDGENIYIASEAGDNYWYFLECHHGEGGGDYYGAELGFRAMKRRFGRDTFTIERWDRFDRPADSPNILDGDNVTFRSEECEHKYVLVKREYVTTRSRDDATKFELWNPVRDHREWRNCEIFSS